MAEPDTVRAALTAIAPILASPLPAQDQPAAPEITLSQVAPAVLRQDRRGADAVIEAAAIDAVIVASPPSFDDSTPGCLDDLDRTCLSPIRRIELPGRAFAAGLKDKGRGRLFVGNTLDGSPGVVDAGLWTSGRVLTPAAGRACCSGGGTSEIHVPDMATGEQTGSISTGGTTGAGSEVPTHFFINLAMDTDGKRLFSVDANSGALYVFDTESGAVLRNVPVGLGALDVAYAPASNTVFLTCRGASRKDQTGTGGLVVIGGDDDAPRVHIPLPAHPNSLTLGGGGNTLFLTVKAPHDQSHPPFRKDGLDSVLRVGLTRLNKVLAALSAEQQESAGRQDQPPAERKNGMEG
ncbi:MAG: hypothetical protein Q4G24_15290 [Paracoccus sp. (in: a-proteobacteria)]|uniref:YncE family protein n=1 Tax=Paracoccus sp. TaxID=267 RepID=UPI0026DF99BA|nr:hypothetical protein [Paracoccus sp. (in: a-proteobacteria)]MDO5622814.1 hypothetical protein [Paracoccus sp. (in: a-proteobacteria)]